MLVSAEDAPRTDAAVPDARPFVRLKRAESLRPGACTYVAGHWEGRARARTPGSFRLSLGWVALPRVHSPRKPRLVLGNPNIQDLWRSLVADATEGQVHKCVRSVWPPPPLLLIAGARLEGLLCHFG